MKPTLDANERKMLHGKEVDAILADALNTNPDFIENDLVTVAPHLGYFSELHADAVMAHGTAEIELGVLEAKLNIVHRERLFASSGVDSKGQPKAPTVDAVKAAVDADPLIREAKEKLLAAEVGMVRARGRVDAVRAKKDAIIQIARTRLAEMSIDPSIAAEHREKVAFRRTNGKPE